MSKKDDNYKVIKDVILSDDFYKNVINEYKEKYAIGLGSAYIVDIYEDKKRKENLQQISLQYIDYLYEKNMLKSVEKTINTMKGEAFSLFANLAFNKEMFPDASVEKYINEAPEISNSVKELLLKPFPEIFTNLDKLVKVEIFDRKQRLKQSFAHTSIVKVMENTFLEQYNKHFENDDDFFSEQNQKFFKHMNHNYDYDFQQFPKVKKILYQITFDLIEKMSGLLLKKEGEDFDKGLEQLIKLWSNLTVTINGEGFLDGNFKNIIEKSISDKNTLEIEEFYLKLTEKCRKRDAEKLLKIIEEVQPNYVNSLINKQEGLTDLEDEIVFKKKFLIKGKFLNKIFKYDYIHTLNNSTIFFEEIQENDLESNFIVNICSKEKIKLSTDEIIDIINEIYPKEENRKKTIDKKEAEEQFKRVLLLKNKLLDSDNKPSVGKKVKI